MYRFSSSGRRRGLHSVVIADMAAAVLFWTSAPAGGSYGWVFQLVGVLLAGLAVYLLTRYSLRSYTYEICSSELVDASGCPVLDLVITQTQGRKITVVARVAVRDIDRMEVLGRLDFRKHRKEILGDMTLFRYDSDPFSPLACYLSVPDENALLAIPPDPGMMECLRRLGGGDGGNGQTPDVL